MFKHVVVGAAALLVVLLAGVLAYATTKPDTLRVERTAVIKAPPDRIFALIDDLHKWTTWSPYEKKDPAMTRTFSGARHGKGAVYEWNGNHQVGQGRMEIIDTSPSKITMDLHFLRPFEGRNIAEFTLQPRGDATEVTWSIHGPSRYITKVMGVFLDMDKMIGADFEAGLANLKTIAEQ